MDKPVNYTREAFLHPVNLGFLIAAFTTAFFISGNTVALNVVMAITLASELLFLGLVPRMAKFQKYINLTKFKERNSKFDERKIFSELSEDSQKRFLTLKHISGLVRDNFKKMPYVSHGILDSINTRIDSLLTSYILLLDSNERYSQYMNNSVESNLKEEIKEAQEEIEASESAKLTQVLNRRMKILHKRLQKYGSAREKYLISESQLKTIEDTVRYVYEKSMTMSNLEEVEHQMDRLIMDLDDADAIFTEINQELNEFPDYLEVIDELENETIETENIRSGNKVKTD